MPEVLVGRSSQARSGRWGLAHLLLTVPPRPPAQPGSPLASLSGPQDSGTTHRASLPPGWQGQPQGRGCRPERLRTHGPSHSQLSVIPTPSVAISRPRALPQAAHAACPGPAGTRGHPGAGEVRREEGRVELARCLGPAGNPDTAPRNSLMAK